MSARGMRTTWDALASSDTEVFVGDPARAREELESLFGRLGADPRGGVCVEVGCGPGRMTGLLAERFERVIALDVSPAMVERARSVVAGASNVELRPVSGTRLDGVPDGVADTLVCYLVLQHLPRRDLVAGYLAEFARVLAPGGRGFVQLPVLEPGARPRLWRALRSAAVPALAFLSRDPARQASFRGFRPTEAELADALARAGLRALARDEGPDSPYRYSRDVFLLLGRA